MMSPVAQGLVTVEEFARLPESKHQELVRGEVIDVTPPGGRHGEVAGALITLLRLWIKQGVGGYAGVEAGCILSRDPDLVRGLDVSYVRADKIPLGGAPEAFWNIAPDLAVEVISPSETADEIREKVRDFLAAGTPLVWAVYPRTREDAAIEYPDVLPGFSCKVAELFA